MMLAIAILQNEANLHNEANLQADFPLIVESQSAPPTLQEGRRADRLSRWVEKSNQQSAGARGCHK
jgi:hypothetical protein